MKELKHLPSEAMAQLYYIYRASVELGHFPVQWRAAIVIPIRKSRRSPASHQLLRITDLIQFYLEVFSREENYKIICENVGACLDQRQGLLPHEINSNRN